MWDVRSAFLLQMHRQEHQYKSIMSCMQELLRGKQAGQTTQINPEQNKFQLPGLRESLHI